MYFYTIFSLSKQQLKNNNIYQKKLIAYVYYVHKAVKHYLYKNQINVTCKKMKSVIKNETYIC